MPRNIPKEIMPQLCHSKSLESCMLFHFSAFWSQKRQFHLPYISFTSQYEIGNLSSLIVATELSLLYHSTFWNHLAYYILIPLLWVLPNAFHWFCLSPPPFNSLPNFQNFMTAIFQSWTVKTLQCMVYNRSERGHLGSNSVRWTVENWAGILLVSHRGERFKICEIMKTSLMIFNNKKQTKKN
jgi:hypothetical protein